MITEHQGVAGAIAILSGGLSVIVYRLYIHPLSKYPGPWHYAAFYLPFLYRNCIRGDFSVVEIEKLHDKYGPIVRVGPNHLSIDGSLGWEPIYGSGRGSKPECLKQKGFFGEFDANSMINAPTEVHRRLRRSLVPGFTAASLKRRGHVVERYTTTLMEQIAKRESSDETFDIGKWLNMSTFDIIVHLVLGSRMGCLENGDYQEWTGSVPDHFFAAAFRRMLYEFPPLLRIIDFLGLSSLLKKEGQLMGGIHSTITRALENPETGDALISDVTISDTDPTAISNLEFATSCITILLAGSETTATTMAGLIYFLDKNPAAKGKLQNELSMFSDRSALTIESTRNLPYMLACINETLRLYTPVPETPPRHTKDVRINDEVLPDNVRVTIFARAANQSAKYFTEPKAFCPERWLPKTHEFYDDKFADDNLAIVRPFSTGPRDCIGKELAWMEMRLFTAQFFFDYDYTLGEGSEDWLNQQGLFAYIRPPLNVTLHKRV